MWVFLMLLFLPRKTQPTTEGVFMWLAGLQPHWKMAEDQSEDDQVVSGWSNGKTSAAGRLRSEDFPEGFALFSARGSRVQQLCTVQGGERLGTSSWEESFFFLGKGWWIWFSVKRWLASYSMLFSLFELMLSLWPFLAVVWFVSQRHFAYTRAFHSTRLLFFISFLSSFYYYHHDYSSLLLLFVLLLLLRQ